LTDRERSKLLNGQALINFQNRYVTKSGKIVWLEWTSIYFSDKEIVFAIAKDITERKKTEKDIEEKYKKFKSLATHFKTSNEEDKKYLAIELHEELAQLASVVKMDVDWISSNETGLSVSSKTRMEHALVVAELLINTIRRISFSISPHMLDDLGLDATLEWHCKEFSILNGIPCLFESAYDEKKLSREIKLDFFRICQEALTNIMYHAQASNVKISIEEIDDKINLFIVDDGKGFTIEEQTKTLGLTRIKERVASINGQLTVQTDPGKRRKICVAIANH
jgi:signal transduction histidine kinase